VVEVSSGVDARDIERAAEGAATLPRVLGVEAVPAAAARRVKPTARVLPRRRGVLIFVDGTAAWPAARPAGARGRFCRL